MSFFKDSAPIKTGHLISLVYGTFLFVAHIAPSYLSDDLCALWGCGELRQNIKDRIRKQQASSSILLFCYRPFKKALLYLNTR